MLSGMAERMVGPGVSVGTWTVAKQLAGDPYPGQGAVGRELWVHQGGGGGGVGWAWPLVCVVGLANVGGGR